MDYLKVYDDMSAFSVTIGKKFIDSTIDSLCNNMNFHIFFLIHYFLNSIIYMLISKTISYDK